jgi:hypothetical protein
MESQRKQFMQYTIVQSTNLEEMIENVSQHIAEGWLPLGGVSTSKVVIGTIMYSQAMTKASNSK